MPPSTFAVTEWIIPKIAAYSHSSSGSEPVAPVMALARTLSLKSLKRIGDPIVISHSDPL